MQQRIRIGDILVAQQIISQDQLRLALEGKNTGNKLGKQLIVMGFIEENTLLSFLSKQLNYPFVELKQFRFDRDLIQTLPETYARRYRVLVLKQESDAYYWAWPTLPIFFV